MTRIPGKVAVVTGAASGIGRAVAYELARRGARLAISDVDEAGLAETARHVRVIGAAVHDQALDVTDREAMLRYADTVLGEYGAVHIVVNNAGVAFTGDVEQMTFAQLERVMDVDFWGVVNGTKAFLPHLIAAGTEHDSTHIVNMSSVFGLFAVPGQSAYNSAKFAVRGFTEALRQEMLLAKHPVQVTCVHPGGIKTGIARNAGAAAGEDAAANAEYFDTKLARLSADAAARTIVRGIAGNRARMLVGAAAKVLDAVVRFAGAHYQRLLTAALRRVAPRAASTDAPAVPDAAARASGDRRAPISAP
jgi:NAD(P)-dependent dehydrogenase (short-subunit alcohol dehydrogenase family)